MKTLVKTSVFILAAAGMLFAAGPENHRFFGDRNSKDKRYELGGSATVDSMILNALNWLSVHRDADGKYSTEKYYHNCKEKGAGKGQSLGICYSGKPLISDSAGTGFALLCFLGAGESDTGDGRFKLAVSQAAKNLMKVQNEDGSFGKGDHVWECAVAAWALAEYRMWHPEDDAVKSAVVKAKDFIVSARISTGLWEGSLKANAFCAAALRSIQESGINVDSAVFKKPLENFILDNSEEISIRAFGAMMCGAKKSDKIFEELKKWAAANPPKWKSHEEAKYGTAFFVSHVLFQLNGDEWKKWEKDCRESLVILQVKGGTASCPKGSYIGENTMYSTEMAVLTLEVYTRFKRFME